MNKLMNFLKTFAVSYIVEQLKKNKDQLIKEANKKIDVRFLNEKQEAELLEIGFDMSLEMVQLLDKKK
mgnify:CR=1 FL=1